MTRYHATFEGQVPFTPEEEAEWDARENQAAELIGNDPQKEQEIRIERDQLLQASDWRALSDQILTEEWKDYRQALRDITGQSGFPEKVIWPTIPEG